MVEIDFCFMESFGISEIMIQRIRFNPVISEIEVWAIGSEGEWCWIPMNAGTNFSIRIPKDLEDAHLVTFKVLDFNNTAYEPEYSDL